MSFVHLHVHSVYSLLDGFSKLDKLIARAKSYDMPAVALTDHGTMFGVVEFFNKATKAGIKPIIGVEAYVSARQMTDREHELDKNSFHLVLLAENMTGYRNLLKIASAAQLEGFYYKPRVDHDFLAAHSEGVIATSACLGGEIPVAIVQDQENKAIELMDWYYEVFGPNHFFLELQNHDIKELTKLNKKLLELGKRYNARYVATNDVHYVDPSDARLQDILLAIQTGKLLSDPGRFRMDGESYYLRSPEEMQALFPEMPEAIQNTLLIAERCEVDLSPTGYHLPKFSTPEGYDAERYLRKLCEEGLRYRYGDHADDAVIRSRLEHELGIIHEMGFDEYFLIVWDLCYHARERDIWYNTRGSAAGSIVAYALRITLIDPIEHGLIFERFLNPGRVSMPDIDLDFPDDSRGTMMEYCVHKYGSDKVAQIITFGTLGARAAIRDVGRVMDIPLPEVDRVAKLIPNLIQGKSVSIPNSLEEVAELKELYDDPMTGYLKDLIDTATQMEGVVRNAGTHAAGVVITDIPIVEYIPLHRSTSSAEDVPIKTVTQFEMSIIDDQGLLKVDFLGLSTLTVMQRACELIKARHGIEYTLDSIPLDDRETFEFMGRGYTAGVFQLEGTGMTRWLMQMKPQNLDHIIAMVALYRPGPMDFIPSYIRRMHAEEKVVYSHPLMEPIFEETYGIPIYQEQIMSAAIELAGYLPSESDDLRKAISKKKKDKIALHQQKFIEGAVKNGIDKGVATQIFADWENFARYGFNKSHAADYGFIAVQTAYLKAHYTVEYMTALLSSSKNDTDKVAFYVADSRSMGLEVLPPDINVSGWDFTVEDNPDGSAAIRFGLGAIKNVGYAPVEQILQAREKGPFENLDDFARRVDLRSVGKRALESLVRVGALDSFGKRGSLLAGLERILSVSTSHFKAAQAGQMSFFGMAEGIEDSIELPAGFVIDEREHLEWERELIGMYVSSHPLNPYLPVIREKITHFSAQLADVGNKSVVAVAGIITRFRPHNTRKGDQMGFVTIEDIQGSVDLVLFPRTWASYHELIQVDNVVTVKGKLDAENGDPKILVDKIVLEELPEMAEGFRDMADEVSADTLMESIFISTSDGDDDFSLFEPDEEDDDEEEAVSPETPGLAAEYNIVPPSADEHMIREKPELVKGEEDPSPMLEKSSKSVITLTDEEWAFAQGFQDVFEEENASGSSKPTSQNVKGERDERMPAGKTVQDETPAMPDSEQIEQGADHSLDPELQDETGDEHSATTGKETGLQIQIVENEPVVPFRYIPPPAEEFVWDGGADTGAEEDRRRMLQIVLRGTGEKERDALRMRRLHGYLQSSPGKDRYSFLIFENGFQYIIEFPNNTTGIRQDLVEKIKRCVGSENVTIEPIQFQ